MEDKALYVTFVTLAAIIAALTCAILGVAQIRAIILWINLVFG